MKKITKVLSLSALVALATGTTALTSCSGSLSQAELDELVKTIIIDNDGAKVSNDFKLPSYVSNGKDLVKIQWHSSNESLLTFKYVEDDPDTKDVDESLEEATAVVVQPTDQLTEVTYYAVLTSGSKTANSDTFKVRIEKAISAEETFKKFYDTCAEKNTMDIAGYVQVKAGKSVYNGKEQCSLFIQEENGHGGFYAYNCYLSATEYDALQVGDYVKVTGQTSSVYNGIYEACYGDVEVDSTKKNAEVANKVVDLTADLKAGNDILYKQNQIAKVEGAVVSSITAADKFTSTSGKYSSTMQNVLKVTIGDAEYSVVLMEGVTPFADAATKTLFDAIIGKVSVADSVNIKGVICGTAFIVTSADDVTVAQAGELTDEQKADKVLAVEAKKFASSYSTDATVTLAEGVTAAVKEGTTATTVVVSGSTVTITPADAKEDVVLVLSYTLNGQAYTKEVTLSTQKPVVLENVTIIDGNNFSTITTATFSSNVAKYTKDGVDFLAFNKKTDTSEYATMLLNDSKGIAKILIDVSGTYENLKVYAGTDNTGTLITATSATGTNGKVWTYILPASATQVYVENPTTYYVNIYSIAVYNGSSADLPDVPETPSTPEVPEGALKATIGRLSSVANATKFTDETVNMADYTTIDVENVISSIVVNRADQTSPDTVYFGASDFRFYAGAQMVITLADGYKAHSINIVKTEGDGTVVISEDGKTITITATAKLKITSIEVIYTTAE